MQAAGEEAGIEGPGDLRAGAQAGGDGNAEHLGDVPARQAPARLGEQDDPVGRGPGVPYQRGECQVARPTQHRVALCGGVVWS